VFSDARRRGRRLVPANYGPTGTRAEQWLFKATGTAFGVLAAVAYYSNENSAL